MDSLRREFSEAETHNFLEIENVDIRNTSAGLGWKRAFMSVQEEGPYARVFPGQSDILINVIQSGRLKATLSVNGQPHPIEGGPGTITIIPDGIGFGLDLRSTVATTRLYIRRKVFDHVIKTIYGCDAGHVDLRFCAAVYDPVLEQLCNAVREALHESSNASLLYVEHMLQAVAAHLGRHYTSAGRGVLHDGEANVCGRHMQRIREIIDSRLAERLTLDDVAREFNLGADHFGRLFKRATGVSLYQYIIRCRVDRARQMLTETTTPIIQIAQECGFADQVHLTRAFRRLVGTTPAVYRKLNRTP